MPETHASALERHSPARVRPREAADRLIVALDLPDFEEAAALIPRLRPTVRWFKVGSELFTTAGPDAVRLVQDHGAQVFLDLKFHDIPKTVAGAVAAAARMGVAMVNVHTAGGEAMLRAAAVAAASVSPRPVIVGVTLLTSHDARVEWIVEAAQLAQSCGLDGVVASAREAPAIKAACGAEFAVVVPGIRPEPLTGDDQRRTATPADAVRWGADYLVVGRPITQAADPRRAAQAVLDAMAATD